MRCKGNRQTCVKCEKSWNVSSQAKIPSSGYVCLHCTGKKNRQDSRPIKRTNPIGWFKKNIAYIIAALAGFVLMPAAIEAAYKERGYFGIGGEYLLPLLFVLIVAAVSEARDMFQEIVATLKEPGGESYEE